MSELEQALATQIRMAGLPKPTREFRAIPSRRWRWDIAFIPNRVLVEVNGGTWVKGGHSSGRGIRRDYEKTNAAVMGGWHPFSVSGDMVRDGSALKLIQEAIHRFPIPEDEP